MKNDAHITFDCQIEFIPLENDFRTFFFYSEIREGIIRCILATDMARHNEILTQFQEITPTFDYSNEVHINLVRSEPHLLIFN